MYIIVYVKCTITSASRMANLDYNNNEVISFESKERNPNFGADNDKVTDCFIDQVIWVKMFTYLS